MSKLHEKIDDLMNEWNKELLPGGKFMNFADITQHNAFTTFDVDVLQRFKVSGFKQSLLPEEYLKFDEKFQDDYEWFEDNALYEGPFIEDYYDFRDSFELELPTLLGDALKKHIKSEDELNFLNFIYKFNEIETLIKFANDANDGMICDLSKFNEFPYSKPTETPANVSFEMLVAANSGDLFAKVPLRDLNHEVAYKFTELNQAVMNDFAAKADKLADKLSEEFSQKAYDEYKAQLNEAIESMAQAENSQNNSQEFQNKAKARKQK